MKLAQVTAFNLLNLTGALLSGGSLVIYSGPQPVTPATALSGNTPLATFTFQTLTPFNFPVSLPNYTYSSALFVSQSVAPSNVGTATFARASMITTVWVINTAYTAWTSIVTANGLLFICIKTGTSASSGPGPVSAQMSIVDNTVNWMYLGIPTATVIGDFTVGDTGTGSDLTLVTSNIVTGFNVTITSFVLQIPST
jgi:hypothetical protein